MAKVHYFQRYSQAENVVTNNTLLLLSRIYHHSPAAFEAVLNGLLDDVGLTVGPSFRQQEGKRGRSTPDGTISQASFRVVIETKLGENYSRRQLVRHFHAFGDAELPVLLLLSPHVPGRAFVDRVQQDVSRLGEEGGRHVYFKAVTFADVIEAVRGVLPDHVSDVRELVDDYEEFCSGEGLLPSNPFKMRVVPCGATLADNFHYRLYYHPASRGYTDLGYIGIYADKSVRGVGKVRNVVRAEVSPDGTVEVRGWTNEEPGREDLEAIRASTLEAVEKHGYDLDDRLYFLVDEFFETDFNKTSKYGLMGEKHFDLREVLGVKDLPNTGEIARRLRELSWM